MNLPRLTRAARRPRRAAPALAVMALLTLSAFLAVGLLPAAPASAADWSIKGITIDATVEPDGDLAVSETRTFVFPGDFRWVEQRFTKQGSRGITGIFVREGAAPYIESETWVEKPDYGTFCVEDTADQVRVRFGFQPGGGERVFTVSYTAKAAVVVHNDVAELYWKFVGSDTEVGADMVSIDVHLPPGAATEEVRAWGHPLLQGNVAVGADLVRFTVPKVPANTFVEGRIAFPTRLVLASQNWSGKDALPEILEEEGRLARAANFRRAAMKFDAYAAILILLAAIVFGVRLQKRYGTEHHPAERPEYFRELPGTYPPAELGVLWNFGSPGAADFVATILDLARRGFIIIEDVRTVEPSFLGFGGGVKHDYRIWLTTRGQEAVARGLTAGEAGRAGEAGQAARARQTGEAKREEGLAAHELYLLRFVTEEIGKDRVATGPGPEGTIGSPVTFSDIAAYGKKRPMEFRTFYGKWESRVKDASRKRDFFDQTSSRGQYSSAAAGGILFAIGAIAFFALHFYVTGVACFIAGAGLFVLIPFLARRSQEGCNHYWLWRGFRHYLTDFSRLREVEPPALAIWDHYLVYATSLGVAKEVIHQLPLVYRDPATQAQFGHGWFVLSGASAAGTGGIGSLTESLGHGIENLASFSEALTTTLQGAVSSASGRGGGFSGGGGGGGGGGGVSAGH